MPVLETTSNSSCRDAAHHQGLTLIPLFEHLPCPALILDPQLLIRNSNAQADELMAAAPSDLKDTSFLKTITRWQRQAVTTALSEVNGRPLRLLVRLSRAYTARRQEIDLTIKASRLPDNALLLLLERQDATTKACTVPCSKRLILEAQYAHNPAGILLVSEEMEMLSFNDEFLQMWSIPEQVSASRDDGECLQTILEQVRKPEQFLEKVHALYKAPHESSTDEIELVDGRTFFRHSYPLYNGNNYLARVWYFFDITSLRQAERAVQVQQKFQEAVLEHIQDGIVACDAQGQLTLFNRTSKEIHGQDISQVPMAEWATHYKLYQSDGATLLATGEIPLVKAFHEEQVKNQEIIIKSAKHGTPRTLRVSGQAMFDRKGEKFGAVISLHDITDLNRVKEQLQHLAYHDQLTSLPNRRLFHDLIDQCLRQALREGKMVGFLFLDLDNFKKINDRHGHEQGDLLLQKLANLLRRCLRDSDLLCRWGGDEFVIALHNLSSEEDAMLVARKICGLIDDAFGQKQDYQGISVSIGVSLYPRDGLVADNLIRQADMAMYGVKRDGKNGFACVACP